MAVGALIGAYQEDEGGGLRALLPLAGHSLIEYQARCASAAGASHVVVLVERIPMAMDQAFESLRREGINLVAVSDGAEAAGRFEPGEMILLIGDGVAPPVDLLHAMVEEEEATIAAVPDDEAHQQFERIDSASRWAGVALVDGRTLGSTAAMLGDWDLQSTLLRRALQAGAVLRPIGPSEPEPKLAETTDQLVEFERQLILDSRRVRVDAASRYFLAPIEDFATERLMETRVAPAWLMRFDLVLVLAAALAFTRGWHWPALAMLVLSTPLDLIAARLATLRLQPLRREMLSRRLLWPAAGLALLGLGWFEARHGSGWGAFVAALTAAAFAQAARVEQQGASEIPAKTWLFSRRNAILLALPFAIGGGWTIYLAALALYATASFFYVQHLRHRIRLD